ncbi:MAG: hypothetical protein NTZ74_07600 [Chloroflexi bacterium]|nr:hypothetical protein [Chloroflexota bacterium]
MKISPIVYGIVVITVFFGIILGFQTAGVWSTSGKVDPSGKAIQPSDSDPTSIKGWMTLEQIVTTYNVPLADILSQFDLPITTPLTTAVKDLESDTFDTSALIAWLQSRTLPIDVPTATLEPIITTTVIPQIATEIPAVVPPVATEHLAPERTITGKTTFQELLDWGVPNEAIQNIFGEPITDYNLIIKDYAVGKGLAFSDMKILLQIEVDKIK